MLKPGHIRNLSRRSGYDFVNYAASDVTVRPKPYRARSRGPEPRWYGPRRATAAEAAQDYCDYANANGTTAPFTKAAKAPLNLNRARHPGRKAAVTEGPKHPCVTRKRTPVVFKTSPGCVYLIGIEGHADYVKIGWSRHAGFCRLNELQTGNPLRLVGVAEKPGTQEDEYNLHARYEIDNVLNEWFTASPFLVGEFGLTWNEYAAIVNDIYAVEL